MSTYTAITTGQVDQDSPITQALATAWKDNLLAISVTDATAPIAAFTWQIEDGAGGTDPIWDHSVDGTVAEIETPIFDAGWEYALIGEGVSINSASNLEFSVYRAANSTYSGVRGIANYTNTTEKFGFFIRMIFPMWSRDMHFAEITSAEETGNSADATTLTGAFHYGGGTTITKARLNTSGSGNIDAGKVYLLKRAEYGGR